MKRSTLYNFGITCSAFALSLTGSFDQSANAQTLPVNQTSTQANMQVGDETNLVINFARQQQGQNDFVVISKRDARLYIIDDGQIRYSFPVGLGENRGDVADAQLRNKVTPVGQFGVAIGNDALAHRLSGMPAVYFECTADGSACAALHSTYLAEFNARQSWINSPTTNDNYFSNGCVNIRPEDMRIVLNFFQNNRAGNNEHVRPYLYIIPHDITQTRTVFGIPANFGAPNAGNLSVSAP